MFDILQKKSTESSENEYFPVSIQLTDEAIPNDYGNFVNEKLEDFYIKLYNTKKVPYNTIEDLKKFITRFPDVPQFKSFLVNCYTINNKFDFEKTAIDNLVKAHPDYAFAKFLLAERYLRDNEFDKMEETLGYTKKISDFIQDELIHVSEFKSYYTLLFYAEMKKDNFENTKKILDVFKEYYTRYDSDYAFSLMLKYTQKTMESNENIPLFQSKSKDIEPIENSKTPVKQISEIPKLENNILYELYSYKPFLEQKIIQEILLLDRQSLIRDLLIILKDSESRYEHAQEDDYKYNLDFALDFLVHIKAEETLDDILEIFKNNDDWLHYYFSYEISEIGSKYFYHLGINQIDKLYDFMLLPGINGFAKAAVNEAIVQIYLQHPERSEEIQKLWDNLLIFYTQQQESDNTISVTFLSLIMVDILPINKKLYGEKIKQLFDMELIDHTMIGDYQAVMKHDRLPEIRHYKNIFDKNSEEKEYYLENIHNDFDEDGTYFVKPSQTLPISSSKIGRNEPCPCGSGKKYKKCCLNK